MKASDGTAGAARVERPGAWVTAVMLGAGLFACAIPSGQPAGYVPVVQTSGAATPPAAIVVATSGDVPVLDADQARVWTQVREERERLFAQVPPDPVLNELEYIFLAAGALDELADAYLRAIEVHGPRSGLQARLAWLYQRMELPTAAAAMANACVAARPDDARCVFVRGFVRGQTPDTSPAALQAVRDDLAQTLVLDPNFQGPGSANAAAIREQVRLLEARLATVEAP